MYADHHRIENWSHNLQGVPCPRRLGFVLLGVGIFHHPAWAVGSYSGGPPAGGNPQI